MQIAETKKEIWEYAKKGIKAYMFLFGKTMGFTKDETKWDIVEALEKMVTFEFHTRIKNLIEEQFAINDPEFFTISYLDQGKDKWHVTVTAEGVESFFVHTLLEEAFKRMLQKESAREASDRADILAVIEKVIAGVTESTKISKKFTIKISGEIKDHHIEIISDDPDWKIFNFEDKDSMTLIERIRKKLPEQIQEEINKELVRGCILDTIKASGSNLVFSPPVVTLKKNIYQTKIVLEKGHFKFFNADPSLLCQEIRRKLAEHLKLMAS